MSELDQLRQEAEQLKNQIRVSSFFIIKKYRFSSIGLQIHVDESRFFTEKLPISTPLRVDVIKIQQKFSQWHLLKLFF